MSSDIDEVEQALLRNLGFPDPSELLGKKIRVTFSLGSVWTTISGVSTCANHDGYPELMLASGVYDGDTVTSVALRPNGHWKATIKSSHGHSDEQKSCKILLILEPH